VEEISGGIDRVVIIGANRVNGRFVERINDYYGNPDTHNGNRKNSAFRRHYGAALLREGDPDNSRQTRLTVSEWYAKDGPPMPNLEEEVSRLLQEHFTFTCIMLKMMMKKGYF